MIKRLLFLFLLVSSAVASAQVSTTSTQALLQSIMRGASGVTTNAISSGAVATAAGDVLVQPSGLRIPVSVAATASSDAIATAGAAAVALCLNPIGVVACPVAAAAAIGSALNALGVGYGPCPNGTYGFICKSPPAPVIEGGGYVWWGNNSASYAGDTPSAACQSMVTLYGYPAGTVWHAVESTPSSWGCYDANNARVPPTAQRQNLCDSGYMMDANGACQYSGVLTPVPVTQTVVHDDLMNSLSHDSVMNKILYDALKTDQAASPGDWLDAYNPDHQTTPVVVAAPPVTGPSTVTKVETLPQPDGSTDTRTTTQQTTVTPTTTGTTVGDSVTTFPSSTVTTVTTVNNVSNVTTTNTTTSNDPQTPQDTTDQCKLHPDVAGCQVLGTAPPAEVIPSQDVPVTYTPVVFASNATCPAPITYNMGPLGGSRSISWQPMCDWLGTIRPLFLALGALACAWIFMESLKS